MQGCYKIGYSQPKQSGIVLFLFIIISEIHIGKNWTCVSDIKKLRNTEKKESPFRFTPVYCYLHH